MRWTSIHHRAVLTALIAVAILAVGLLALVGAKPVWAAEPNFAPPQNYPVGTSPTTVTNADFNSDGKMDLAAQNYGSDTVSVLVGKGDGTFQDKKDFAVGSDPTAVISGQFNDDNADGKVDSRDFVDLAVANQTSDSVSVLLGNGDGTFQAKRDSGVDPDPSSIRPDPVSLISGDFNGDGKADLAVANVSSNSSLSYVQIMLGSGDGTFQPAASFNTLAEPNQIITADFNGDGKADLAVTDTGSPDCEFTFCRGGAAVFLGNGDGTFRFGSRPLRAFLAFSVNSGDFNGDGKADLAAVGYSIDKVVVTALGNGDGTFQGQRFFGVGSTSTAVTSADFDEDSNDDLAVSNHGSNNVSVLASNGDGTFQAKRDFAVGTGPIFVIGAKLNADNLPDLAVANQDSHNISVLLNTTPPPPPDTTPPTTTHTVSPLPNSAGWNNSNVTVTLNATDTGGSGVREITYSATGAQSIASTTAPGRSATVNITTEGTTTITYFATDKATNEEEPKTLSVKLDKTTPQVTPGDVVNNVWRNSSLSEQFTASDFGSGLANSADASFMLIASEESASATQPTVASKTVLDVAGNSTTRKVSALIDKSAPTGNLTINAGDAFTNTSAVNLTPNAADSSAGSGVAQMRFSNDGSTYSEWVAYDATPEPWTLANGDGTKTVHAQYIDNAGNLSASVQDTIKLDTALPTTTASRSPAANSAGWNNSNVTVTLNATDTGGSGVKEITYSASGAQSILETVYNPQNPPVINTEGTTTITYFATDNAGNDEEPKTVMVNLDKSAPTLDTDNSDGSDGITPNNRETGVSRAIEPTATFSEEMDPTSLDTSAKLYQWNARKHKWQAVPVAVSVVGEKATLDPYPSDPLRQLAANKKFKVTITTGAKNLAGLSLTSKRSWTFTTGST